MTSSWCRLKIHWQHSVIDVDFDKRVASFERADGSHTQAKYDLLVAAGKLSARCVARARAIARF